MIISYEGQQYPFSLDDVTVQQALKIEKYMGCSFTEWGKRLQGGEDMRARQVLGWLILHPDGMDRAGLAVAIEDTDFKLVRLGEALDAAFAAEAAAVEAEAGPVPTAAVSNGHQSAASSPENSPPSWDEISR